MMFKIVRTYKNKKYLNKFIFRNEVEFVNKFKQLDKNKSISNVILIPDKLKIRKNLINLLNSIICVKFYIFFSFEMFFIIAIHACLLIKVT